MNDVLPKPFTKEGLLTMLEKHLGHLKKMQDGIEIPHGASAMPQSSATQSLKDEGSPAPSISTISNWNSPSQFGVSPTQAPAGFLQSMHPYSTEQSPVQYQSAHSLAGPRPMQHRRQISEIGADDLSNEVKRQRLFDPSVGMGGMGRPQ